MSLLSSPAIPANPSPQLQALLKYSEAFRKSDFDTLESIITDDYVHYIHPEASMGSPHLKGKQAFISHFKPIMPVIGNYSASIKEIIEVPGKIVSHSVIESKTPTGFDYKNEHIAISYLVQQSDGSYKVSAVKEFTDSKHTFDFTAHLESKGITSAPKP